MSDKKILSVDEINQEFEKVGGYYTGGETNFLCPYTQEGLCEDRPKGSMRGRFYIESNTEMYRYICFKCNRSGFVNSKILNMLGIDKSIIPLMMRSINHYRETVGYDFAFRDDYVYSNDNIIENTIKCTPDSVAYFEKRMGIKVTSDISEKFSLVMDLYDFAQLNRPKITDMAYDKIMQWHSRGFGFLSHDRSTIIFRDINKNTKADGKYGSVALTSYIKDPDKMYMIVSDKCLSMTLTIYMVEGQFDAIGFYKYIFDNNLQNEDFIIVGVSGIRFHSVLNKIITRGEIRHLNVVIIRDEEIPIKKIQRAMISTPIKAYAIWTNQNGKDTGDPVKEGAPVFDEEYIINKTRIKRKRR